MAINPNTGRETRASWSLAAAPPRIQRILAQAAIDWGIQVRHVRDTSEHDPRAVMARRQAVKEIYKLGFSLAAVGKFLGGMHHTSVLYALRQTKPKRPPKYWPAKSELPIAEEPAAAERFPDLSGEWAI